MISPRGWEIHVFQKVSPKSRNSLELQDLLVEKGIPLEADTVVREKRFGYGEEDLGSIAAAVEEELGSITGIVREVGEKVSGLTG